MNQGFKDYRILWVDDNAGDIAAQKLFPSEETKIVKNMDNAIQEFSGDNLYMYDTIVLDIDFSNGILDSAEIAQKLREKIYLSKDQAEDSNYIRNNGGYLLYLYLLERGYPSDQVAFLTGNANIISQLKAFNDKCLSEMSKEEISDAIIHAWEKTFSKEGSGLDAFEAFEDELDKLPIDVKYKMPPFPDDCEDKLIDSDWDGVRKLVNDVPTDTPIETVENTGDKIIFRFHDANLEAPCFFSKQENDINGHNREDAQKWLDEHRTKEHLLRWLLLDAGDFVSGQFKQKNIDMNHQIHEILELKEDEDDGGIYTAFKQMNLIIGGLRKEHKGAYYQAILAMLIPFDTSPQPAGEHVNTFRENSLRCMCAVCLKQARNFCVHDCKGEYLSVETSLYLLMLSMTAVLNFDQRKEKEDWYWHASKIMNEKYMNSDFEINNLRNKVLKLTNSLLQAKKITVNSENDESNVTISTPPRNILYALSNNKEINKEQRKTIKEEYYIFSIASYILLWFNCATVETAENKYGKPVAWLYRIALNIVNKYDYPEEL